MDTNDVIGVQCPFGHDLFPYGTTQRALGFVFLPWHKYMEVLPEQERRWIYSKEYLEANPQPKHYKHGCFRLTRALYYFLDVKCLVCEK